MVVYQLFGAHCITKAFIGTMHAHYVGIFTKYFIKQKVMKYINHYYLCLNNKDFL